jgi:hemerythrin-like domain-containing protein
MFDQVLNGYLSAMTCEHRHIEQLVRSIQATLDEASTKNRPPEVMNRLLSEVEELETCLTRHFQREEDGGFVEDAVVAAPRFAKEAQELLVEHEQMLTKIREIVHGARAHAKAHDVNWPAFAADVRNFVRQLKSHEVRENGLLHRAFNYANGS